MIDCEDEGRGFHFHSGERRWAVVEGFTITRGYFDYYDPVSRGAAILCENSSPTIMNCSMEHNQAYSGAGGAIYCISSRISVVDCTIANNYASVGGGMFCSESDPEIVGCNISNNTTWGRGGGICFDEECYPELLGCLIADNRAGFEGGGIFCDFPYNGNTCRLYILNCTIAGNRLYDSSHTMGSGIYLSWGRAIIGIENTIIWGNSAAEGCQVELDGSYVFLAMDHCCYPDEPDGISGAEEVTVTECIHLDPLFVDAPGGDYHLKYRSPCINSGENGSADYYFKYDLDGNLRIQGSAVDIGAYEKR